MDRLGPREFNGRRISGSVYGPIPVRKVSGCVMSVRRSALGDNRFDADYRGAGAEDVDLSWRISELFPILLAPRARLAHLRTPTGPKRQHWLAYTAACQYYLYNRLWRPSLMNALCFAWLNCGLVFVAATSSMRQCSLVPFRALLGGIRRSSDLLASSETPAAPSRLSGPGPAV